MLSVDSFVLNQIVDVLRIEKGTLYVSTDPLGTDSEDESSTDQLMYLHCFTFVVTLRQLTKKTSVPKVEEDDRLYGSERQ